MAKVEVEIFGQRYKIEGDDSSEYLKKVADFVDFKMKEVVKETGLVDSYKIAILTCLIIADELFRTKKKLSQLQEEFERKVESLIKKIEEV